MDDSLLLADTLECLLMKDIVQNLLYKTFSPAEKRTHANMDAAVGELSASHHAALEDIACSKKRRLAEQLPPVDKIAPLVHNTEDNFFFKTISDEVRCGCLSWFIQSTGQDATSIATCAVCTGQFFCQELTEVKLADL
jgi:hypothetical protein